MFKPDNWFLRNNEKIISLKSYFIESKQIFAYHLTSNFADASENALRNNVITHHRTAR